MVYYQLHCSTVFKMIRPTSSKNLQSKSKYTRLSSQSDNAQTPDTDYTQMQQPEGLQGTTAFTSQCFGLQVADTALMNVDTSEHAQYIHNQHSSSTVKQCWLRQPTKR